MNDLSWVLSLSIMSASCKNEIPVIGVLALQGAFEEHQTCMENATGCKTVQIRKPGELKDIDGIILPGGESTAMGLIGSVDDMWKGLQDFVQSGKPTWGTCAGMILLAERCVGGSAVIENGQSLIGGMDVLVCRNYFGSQVSSFEMATPPPPGAKHGPDHAAGRDYPGVFIRAPAILNAAEGVEVLGKVVATPCRQAAVVLRDLETKIAAGENVIMMNVVDALQRTPEKGITYTEIIRDTSSSGVRANEKANENNDTPAKELEIEKIELPGAADGTNAREVICAARKDKILITAFHPELTNDYRWHSYFYQMVVDATGATK